MKYWEINLDNPLSQSTQLPSEFFSLWILFVLFLWLAVLWKYLEFLSPAFKPELCWHLPPECLSLIIDHFQLFLCNFISLNRQNIPPCLISCKLFFTRFILPLKLPVISFPQTASFSLHLLIFSWIEVSWFPYQPSLII